MLIDSKLGPEAAAANMVGVGLGCLFSAISVMPIAKTMFIGALSFCPPYPPVNPSISPVFVGGEWNRLSGIAATPVYNPSTGDVIAETPQCTAAHVDDAVEAAAAAFPAWAETPPTDRARVLFRFKTLLEENFEDLVRSNTREHGKTLVESRGDVKRGIEMVEFACGVPSLLMGEALENVARGIDCETIRQPLGVCVGITPFNFPTMVPLWMYPVAIACGNTFVLKPSEKVPLTAIKVAELLEEAGLPKGVLNIVHGGRECVDALLTHPKVKAVSFVGSTAIARHIYETGTKHGKRVQSNGGAKNFVLLMPDADVDNSVRGVIEAAFGCAGERCMAGSTAVIVGDAAKSVLPSLVEAARRIKSWPDGSRAPAGHGAGHYPPASRPRCAIDRSRG